MATLDSAYEEVSARSRNLSSNVQKQPRLVADPAMSVQQIATVLTQYAVYRGSVDFWSLVAPPPSAPQKYNFKTVPHPLWISKTLGLAFELLDIASNTKFLSVKVQKALRGMIEQKHIAVPVNVKPEDYVDKIDVAIRVIMAMLRKIKVSVEHKTKVTRYMSNAEKTKLELVLNKISLPANYFDEEEGEGSADLLPLQHSLAETRAVVPFVAISCPNIFVRINSMSFDAPEQSSLAFQRPAHVRSCSFADLLEEAEGFVPAAVSHAPKKKDLARASADAKHDCFLQPPAGVPKAMFVTVLARHNLIPRLIHLYTL